MTEKEISALRLRAKRLDNVVNAKIRMRWAIIGYVARVDDEGMRREEFAAAFAAALVPDPPGFEGV